MLVGIDYHTPPRSRCRSASRALPLLVLLVGRSIANTHSWIEFGAFRLQPSEPMKPLTALMLASIMGDPEGDSRPMIRLGKVLLVVMVPVGLILVEPDMGTALTYLPMLVVAAFLGGVRGASSRCSCSRGSRRTDRLEGRPQALPEGADLTVFDPSRDPAGVGYQVQSRIAIGSRLTGKGWTRH